MRSKLYYNMVFGDNYHFLRIITRNKLTNPRCRDIKFQFKISEYNKRHYSSIRIKNGIIIQMIKNERYLNNPEIFDIVVKEDFKNIFWEKYSIIIKYT